ncbi:MAG: methyl-accepting chemotaxis protein [Defluviitaleaceae bacterium]|nr:methyl-accepting chemotaxis protein [Defluviitaleaceae bacterium]
MHHLSSNNDKFVKSWQQKKRVSVTTRITIAAIAMTLVLGMSITIFGYFVYRDASIEYYGQKAANIANSVAGVIDPLQFNASIQNPEPDEYRNYLKWQIDSIITRSPSIEFLYIIVPHENNLFAYFASAVRPGQDEWVYFMQAEHPGTYGSEIVAALRQGQTIMSGMAYAEGWGLLVSSFAPIFDQNGRGVALVGVDINADHVTSDVNRFTIVMAVFVLLGCLISGIVLRYLIVRFMHGSFARIVDVGSNFSDSSLNFASRDTDKHSDEITAKMYYQFSEMYNNFKMLITDIEHMSEAHLSGYYNARLDESKYTGGNLHLVKQMNAMTKYYVDDFIELINTMKQYSEGNFSHRVRDYEGEWAWASEVINNLRSSFVHLTKEIDKVAKSAANGKFNVSADVDSQKGEWADIISSLNALVKAIAEPLAEIESSLNEMEKGNFENARINKTFKGTFENVKNALNATEETTQTYVNEIAGILDSMANGDLTVTIKRDYIGSYAPIKASLSTILKSLNVTMADIQTSVEQVASGSEQITTSAMHLADSATMQSASIEELSNAITLIHEKASQASQNAELANQSTARSQEHAVQGMESVKFMGNTMNKVRESSESISKINSVINGISFQTNLLALNASIEAARAGEHGKGFSVVADEVRTLAGRSQQSASDTATIVAEDLKHVAEGVNAASEVVTSFETISNNIGEISNLVSQIADISGEQLESISGVNDSVLEITKAVTNTSATAEESAAASQELNSQAELLKQKVAFFKIKTN